MGLPNPEPKQIPCAGSQVSQTTWKAAHPAHRSVLHQNKSSLAKGWNSLGVAVLGAGNVSPGGGWDHSVQPRPDLKPCPHQPYMGSSDLHPQSCRRRAE